MNSTSTRTYTKKRRQKRVFSILTLIFLLVQTILTPVAQYANAESGTVESVTNETTSVTESINSDNGEISSETNTTLETVVSDEVTDEDVVTDEAGEISDGTIEDEPAEEQKEESEQLVEPQNEKKAVEDENFVKDQENKEAIKNNQEGIVAGQSVNKKATSKNTAVAGKDISSLYYWAQYDHIDVRVAGTMKVETQVNGVTTETTSYNATVSGVTATVNGSSTGTFYKKNGSGKENEWRADGLNLKTTDTVVINCTITTKIGSKDVSWSYSKSYTGDALVAAVSACPGKSGSLHHGMQIRRTWM